MTRDEIIAREEQYQLRTYKKLPIVVERGEGSWIWDSDGRKYLDFYGGHCVTLLGHCHPTVVQAIKDQADRILFYSNLVYSEVRAMAAGKLAELAPVGLENVFFCNSGTEANETALKLARKHTGRSRVISFEGDFHGRTIGSLATTWEPEYRAPYQSALPETTFVPYNNLEALEQVFGSGEPPAAILIEPIQSIAGMTEASAEFVRMLRYYADKTGSCLIFDEVQTGVGRTGSFSISTILGVKPDLITLAKSLGSGLPVGAVLVASEIAGAVAYGDQGTTFGGGMMAMAAVSATLDVLIEQNLMSRAPQIHKLISAGSSRLGVGVRGRGCLMGLELPEGVAASRLLSDLRERGVVAGGSSQPGVIRIMPPLTTLDEEVQFFLDALELSLS